MKVKKYLKLTLAFTLFNFAFLHASGAAVNGVSPRSHSLQGAFTAVADDASAVFYNPAGLTQVKGTTIENGLMIMAPKQKYTSLTGATFESDDLVYGPNLFMSTDYLKPFTFGLGVYAPFARQADYGNVTTFLGTHVHRAEIVRKDIVPSIAFDISDKVSLGMGLVFSSVDMDSDILGLEEEASGEGFGFQVGTLIKLKPNLNLGVNYRGPMNTDLDGTGTVAGISDSFDTVLKFPETLSFGLAWDINEEIKVSANYDLEHWSRLDEVRRVYTNPLHNGLGLATLNTNNGDIIRLGVIYRESQKNEWRAGYGFSPMVVPAANILPAKPDYDVHLVSVGYSRYCKQSRFDVGYVFEYAPKLDSTNPIFSGVYEMNAHAIVMSFTYQFNKQN